MVVILEIDIGMELNMAMFARAGRSGYVLKPEILRRKGLEKDKDALVRVSDYSLEIEVRCVFLSLKRDVVADSYRILRLSRLYPLNNYLVRLLPLRMRMNLNPWIPWSKLAFSFLIHLLQSDAEQRSCRKLIPCFIVTLDTELSLER